MSWMKIRIFSNGKNKLFFPYTHPPTRKYKLTQLFFSLEQTFVWKIKLLIIIHGKKKEAKKKKKKIKTKKAVQKGSYFKLVQYQDQNVIKDEKKNNPNIQKTQPHSYRKLNLFLRSTLILLLLFYFL